MDGKKGKKVLIVDDDENIVRILAINLRLEGHEVASAFDGVTAVMQAHRFQPDLILLDIMMPGGNGFSVVDKLHNSTRTIGIPIVFISALPKEDLDQMATEAGVSHYFSKPFDMNSILYYINNEMYLEEARARAAG
jgi:DNA-binding response OmpR family regulator